MNNITGEIYYAGVYPSLLPFFQNERKGEKLPLVDVEVIKKFASRKELRVIRVVISSSSRKVPDVQFYEKEGILNEI